MRQPRRGQRGHPAHHMSRRPGLRGGERGGRERDAHTVKRRCATTWINCCLLPTSRLGKCGKNKDKHTLRFTLDLLNLGNFLDRNWGLYKTPALSTSNGNIQLLKFEGLAADGKTPSFSFPYYDSGNQIPATTSFTNNTSTSSRWQMQFGIRYLFN